MSLMLLIGGARSGKSQLAVRLALDQHAPVTFLATGEPGDPEMQARIDAHREQRPPAWRTIEEPIELLAAIEQVPRESCLIVDCLTLWTANALETLGASATEARAAEAATLAAGRDGLTIVVSNEVGLGIVPDNPVPREYRDLLGRVNTIWADAADHAFLVMAGRALKLRPPQALMEEVK